MDCKLILKSVVVALIVSLGAGQPIYAQSSSASLANPVKSSKAGPLMNANYYKAVMAEPSQTIRSSGDWQSYINHAKSGEVLSFQISPNLTWDNVKNMINQASGSNAPPAYVMLNAASGSALTLLAGDAASWLSNGVMVGVGQNISIENSTSWQMVGTNDAPLVIMPTASNDVFGMAGQYLRNGIYAFANNDQIQAYFNGLNQWSGNGKPTALFLGNGDALSKVATTVKPKQYSGLGYVVNPKQTTEAQMQQIGNSTSAATNAYAVDTTGEVLTAALVAGLVAGITAAAFVPPYYASYGWGGYPVNDTVVNNYVNTYNRYHVGDNNFHFATDGQISKNVLDSGAFKNGNLMLSHDGQNAADAARYNDAIKNGDLKGMTVNGAHTAVAGAGAAKAAGVAASRAGVTGVNNAAKAAHGAVNHGASAARSSMNRGEAAFKRGGEGGHRMDGGGFRGHDGGGFHRGGGGGHFRR